MCLGFSLVACASSGAEKRQNGSAESPEPSVELGVPTGDDGLDFAPLEDGSELRLKTFGQGGTHVILGVRTIGFGIRAFVGFTLRDETTGNEIVAPPPVRPQLFFCDEADASVCDLVPVTVMTGGLAGPDEERDGLDVSINVTAETESGISGSDQAEVVLSTADLQ
jgi:hypothetical protein